MIDLASELVTEITKSNSSKLRVSNAIGAIGANNSCLERRKDSELRKVGMTLNLEAHFALGGS